MIAAHGAEQGAHCSQWGQRGLLVLAVAFPFLWPGGAAPPKPGGEADPTLDFGGFSFFGFDEVMGPTFVSSDVPAAAFLLDLPFASLPCSCPPAEEPFAPFSPFDFFVVSVAGSSALSFACFFSTFLALAAPVVPATAAFTLGVAV